MKKFTKVISLLLTAVMFVMLFTACGAKSEIKEVILTYQNAGVELDLEKAQSCLDPECEQYAALAEGIKSGSLTESLAQMGLEEAELKKLLKEYGKLIETDITGIKVDKKLGEATALLTTKTPDMESMDENVMEEFMTSKKITQEDLMKKASSQEEINKLMLEMVEWMIIDKAPSLEKITENKEISLKKIEGRWLISNIAEADVEQQNAADEKLDK